MNDSAAMAEHKSDSELVSLTLQNQDNFLYLIRRYEQKLLAYIRRLTNVSREEAEDILQEVFVKVYINLNSFDRSLKFSSWIYRIAHNEVISHFRRQLARPQVVSWPDSDSWLALADDAKLDKEIDAGLINDKIRSALSQLDIKYREVLVLRYLEDKSYEEIADILHKPAGTVATLINRAKTKLKNYFLTQNIKL